LNTQLRFNAVKGGVHRLLSLSIRRQELNWTGKYEGGTINSFRLCTSSTACFSAEIGYLTSHNNVPFVIASNPASASIVPIPATLPLFATGLGALGLLGWRSCFFNLIRRLSTRRRHPAIIRVRTLILLQPRSSAT